MHKSIKATLDRRAFTTALAFAPITAASVSAHAHDPVLPLIKRWREAVDICDGLAAMSDDDNATNSASAEVTAIAFKLAETVPTTLQGLARYLDFTRKQFHTGDHSGWADDVDLKATDSAITAAFAIAGMEG